MSCLHVQSNWAEPVNWGVVSGIARFDQLPGNQVPQKKFKMAGGGSKFFNTSPLNGLLGSNAYYIYVPIPTDVASNLFCILRAKFEHL